MKAFYFTITKHQAETHVKNGLLSAGDERDGCIEVQANDRNEARDKMWNVFGAKWSFQYDSIESVHEYDRYILDRIP